ncbi:hypothetical protein [Ktedonospora formicarum]|uniref:hypothetical protein n=1 Tax=Ktedonospora formicarum TaxID=2778364 RepID=UPI001F15BE80|nr:hypothetical protein [Ktedonospora formicarum]
MSFLPFFPPMLENLTPVIACGALVGFGLALLQPQRGEATQPSTTSASAEARA